MPVQQNEGGADGPAGGAGLGRLPWPPILFLGALVAAHVATRVAPLPLPLPAGLAVPAGWIVTLAGLGLMAWAFVSFWRHRTNIMPTRPAGRLLVGGPFAVSRNPIYLSEAIVLLGLGLIDRAGWYWVALPIFVLAVTRLAIEPEERHMEARFGADWQAYRARVRRWL
jgi:protein-S-isoprenylcysteine O-methyltransferase Ste14